MLRIVWIPQLNPSIWGNRLSGCIKAHSSVFTTGKSRDIICNIFWKYLSFISTDIESRQMMTFPFKLQTNEQMIMGKLSWNNFINSPQDFYTYCTMISQTMWQKPLKALPQSSVFLAPLWWYQVKRFSVSSGQFVCNAV